MQIIIDKDELITSLKVILMILSGGDGATAKLAAEEILDRIEYKELPEDQSKEVGETDGK